VVQAGVVQPVTTVPQSRFLFTGREYDALTGIYHYRARAYSTKLGRFLQLDPIDFDGGDLNVYRYVGNDPVNWIDPWGLQGSDYNQRIGGSSNPGSNAIKNPFDPDQYSPEAMQDSGMAASLCGMALSIPAIVTPAGLAGFGASALGAWTTMQTRSRPQTSRASRSGSHK